MLTAQERGAAPRAGKGSARRAGDQSTVFTNVTVRPGFVIADTSLSVYFDVTDGQADAIRFWEATVYEDGGDVAQASVRLSAAELAQSRDCGYLGYCRDFGRADGWVLDPAKGYYVTLTAFLANDSAVVSAPSAANRPQVIADWPAMPKEQAAGCLCGNALGMSAGAQANRGQGLNTGTGAFVWTTNDMSMDSFAIPFASGRVYNSANDNVGLFGRGWSWTYGMRVDVKGEAAWVTADDGAVVVYPKSGDGYARPAGVRSNLRKVATGWELTTLENVVYGFDAAGRLSSILNARQRGIRIEYQTSPLPNRLTMFIRDASGRTARVAIDRGRIKSIQLPDMRTTWFNYDSTDMFLSQIKDPNNEYWMYRYDNGGRLSEVNVPAPGLSPGKRAAPGRANLATYVRNEYDDQGRVIKQTDGDGDVTSLAWDAAKQVATTTDPDGVAVRDGYRGNSLIWTQFGAGEVIHRRYDAKLNRSLVVSGRRNQHQTNYNDEGRVVRRKAPEPFDSATVTEYDKRGNPEKFVDENKKVWTAKHNEFDELMSATDAEKHKIDYAYDADGLLKSKTVYDYQDKHPKVTSYEYYPKASKPDDDANFGMLKAVTAPGAKKRRTEYEYDPAGRRTRIIDPRGAATPGDRAKFTTQFTYTPTDLLSSTTRPGGGVWSTSYNGLGQKSTTQSPTGELVWYFYTTAGLLERTQIRAGSMTWREQAFEYTKAGRRAKMIARNPRGPDLVTSYEHNPQNGLLVREVAPRGNENDGKRKAEFTTEYTYDRDGNVIRVTKPDPSDPEHKRKIIHETRVDEMDRVASTIDEYGKVASKVKRDDKGQAEQVTDALGRATAVVYDDNGRQAKVTENGQSVGVTSTYDESGRLVKRVSAVGGITTWEFDDDGLLLRTVEPRGNASGADPKKYATVYTYDQAGNLETVTDPRGNVTRYRYDARNRLDRVTDARGNTTDYQYRQDDKTEAVIDAAKAKTSFGYHPDGQVKSVTDGRTKTAAMEYDFAGRPSARIDPLGRRTEFGYDANSNLTSTLTLDRGETPSAAERKKRTMADEYDILDRRQTRKLGDAGPEYRWAYDAKDRVRDYIDPTGKRAVGYDDEDQITTVDRFDSAGQKTEAFSYGYDARGNVTSRTFPDRTVVTAEYDGDSRAEWVQAAGGAAGDSASRWKYTYDPAGRLDTMTMPASAGGLVEDRDYDTAGRLTRVRTVKSGSPDAAAPVTQFDLAPDPVGNPQRIDTTRDGVRETVGYAYDKVNRVEAACYASADCKADTGTGRISYTYDEVGNRRSQTRTGNAGDDVTTYGYDDANQLNWQSVKPKTGQAVRTEYGYDVRGNQTRDGAGTATYNLDNTLASATVSGRTTNYAYDAAGLRLTATTGSGQQPSTQRFAWDVNGALPHIAVDTTVNGRGEELSRRGFVYGADDDPLALLDPKAGVHSYVHDWLGGVADLIAPGGKVVESYDYDPFGNPRTGPRPAAATQPAPSASAAPTKTAAAPVNPLRYTGAYQDSSSGEGNYFLRARNYSPGTGRFTATDPMPSDAGSQYAYGNNNPISNTDPTGMRPIEGNDGPARPSTPATNAGAAGDSPPDALPGVNPEDLAKAQQLQSKSVLDVVLEAGGQILMEVLGLNDILGCFKGDLGACAMAVIGALPWGKIVKAKKIGEAILKAGRAVITFYAELKWARTVLAGAAKAAEAAKAAAAAAKAAALKAAKAKEAAEAAAKAAKARAAAAVNKVKDRATTALGRGCKDNSFVAGTRVLMADGSTRRIEDLKPGDKVAASDPKGPSKARSTREVVGRTITATIARLGEKHLVKLSVGAGKGGSVTATTNHPMWEPKLRKWAPAGDLQAGSSVRTSAGTALQVKAAKTWTTRAKVYNLTVDGLHTYHVLAGNTPILVHNCGDEIFHPGRNGADDSPQDWIPRSSMGRSGSNLAEGNHHFVVMPDKSVRTFHESIWDTAPGAGHTSLSRGNGVIAAGTFDVGPGGMITRFDNFSGHYKPGAGTVGVIRSAFARNGFDLRSAHWDPFEFP
ncbi:hypothetical protein GCM10010201_21830 [Pilimelia columellifera subsp. columellifera]|uniref:Hint domain-containing protein n=2 Tax=Pilimelia TaxID=53370 RepID=A0ABN3NJF3_9ACTN